MRRLLPEPARDIDPYDEYGDVAGRDWLRLGMVMSVDGSVTDEEGWTDGLGGAADFRVFRTLRALADAVLVGAGTVRTGRLGPARLAPELRRRRGRPPAPIVVVTRSLELDWTLPLFTSARTPTLVVTCQDALRHPARPVPEAVLPYVVTAGREQVDLAGAVRRLRSEHGLGHLLCEGGPGLFAALLAEGLVDELCLSLAPALIAGGGHLPLLGPAAAGLPRVPLEQTAAYTDDGVLFLRYAVGAATG
jgi:5-amino-6-(5-phosphoribosylamino)uracil reductase